MGETGLAEPKTKEEWQELRKRVAAASAEDFPEVDPAKFDEFKKVLLGGPNYLVQLPFVAVVGFLLITEYVLGVVHWGAIEWLLAVVVGMVGGGLVNVQLAKTAESKAQVLGREIGLFA